MADIKDLEKQIKENLEKIKDKDTLKRIEKIIVPLRKEMDKYDSFLIDFKDGLKRGVTFLFGNKAKDKIRNDLFDIVEGFEHYSSDDKNKVFNALTEVSNIHDRNFWDKIVSVLRAS